MGEGHNAAYGFRWGGLYSPALGLVGADDWPLISVRERHASDDDVTTVDADRASIQTPTAQLRLYRTSSTMEIVSPLSVPISDVVHPTLWPAASIFARWRSRETLHAGAFSLDGETAWAVLGERGAGKSSLLAALALRGVEVLSDDLLVIDGNHCYAGPRCIDLRPEGAAALGVVRYASMVRSTERRRLALEPCSGTYRLGGFVSLAWGASISASPVAPAESFGLLVDHRRVGALGADFAYLLELSGMPALRFTRPHAWRSLGSAVAELTQAVTEFASRSMAVAA
jgi:hypothetical protein